MSERKKEEEEDLIREPQSWKTENMINYLKVFDQDEDDDCS